MLCRPSARAPRNPLAIAARRVAGAPSTSLLRARARADIFLCTQATTRTRMLKYATDEPFFFKSYAAGLTKMGALGWGNSLKTLSI